LLDLFLEVSLDLKINICAAHLNHDLRGEDSERDELFVRELCELKKIELVCEKRDVKKFSIENKLGIEEAARLIRYEFLEESRLKLNASKIAIAHNKNDNAETVLMKLFRGSGLNGLSGIRISDREKKIIRPLLEIERFEIEEYLRFKNLSYRFDKSNLDLSYARNKIRYVILKSASEINNKVIKNLTQASKIISQEDNYLNRLAKEFLELEFDFISLDRFERLDLVLKRRVLKIWLESKKINISFELIDRVLKLSMSLKNKRLELDKNFFIYKLDNRLEIFEKLDLIKKKFLYKLELDKKIFISELNKIILITREEKRDKFELNNKKNLVCEKIWLDKKIINKLVIRNYEAQDKIYFKNLDSHVLIKKLLAQKKLSLKEKNLICLIAQEESNNIFYVCELNIKSELRFINKKNFDCLYIYIYEL
jgi:tRNA(Ile)-lysidine synthase